MKLFCTLAIVLLGLLAVVRPGDARAFEVIGAVWSDYSLPVPYCVNTGDIPLDASGGPIVSPNTFAAMVQAAFQKWQDVPGTRVAVVYRGQCDNDPDDTYDGSNTIGFASLSGAAGGRTGMNFTDSLVLRDGTRGEIIEADIVVDSRFADYYDPEYYRVVVLPHILLHEAGHFLGLDHSSNPCSVMIATGFNPKPGELCDDDIAAIRALYPAG